MPGDTLTQPCQVSVIVATRDRAASLRQTLGNLASQDTQGLVTYEVLVVDNGSTDQTRQTVTDCAAGYPVSLRYVHEPRAGKPHALNCGIGEARGDVLAFTDDDVVVDAGWVLELWQSLQETGADGVGGRVLPLWVDGRPEWMTDRALRQLGALGCVDFGVTRLQMAPSDQEYWWVGSNMAVRRSLMARLERFDERRVRGQDTELFQRCARLGARIWYEPAALVHHRIGRERLTPAYFRHWYWRAGRHRAHAIAWRPHHLLTMAPIFAYREIARWLARWTWSWCRLEPAWSRLAYECRLRAAVGVVAQRLTEWPRACRGYLGAALRGLRCTAGIFQLLAAPDAVVRALGRALGASAWRRRSPAEAAWASRIEALRTELNASTQVIELENYGVGRPDAPSSQGSRSVTTVGETCRRTSKSPRAAELLMAVLRQLRPEQCLELGTSVGVSGAYQAAALELNGTGRLVTLEGASAKAQLARQNFRRLVLTRASVVTGRFQDTLPEVLRAMSRVDVAFVDGHHDEHATVAYFQQIVPCMPAGGVLMFDDIAWSDGMRRAWRAIQADARVRTSVTLDDLGLCVVGAATRRARHVRVPLSL